ncbi:hypothetical protein ACP4OV_018581 [Aristida adscensionis]
MAALEAVEATNASSFVSDGYVVSSYLSLLAMLMDREEDVQHLRRKGMLCSCFSDTKTLTIMDNIYEYMDERPVRIAVHKFVHNNYRIIAAVLSIAGVLVGIFKALYSLKQS